MTKNYQFIWSWNWCGMGRGFLEIRKWCRKELKGGEDGGEIE